MGKTSESRNQEFRKNTGAWEEQPPALGVLLQSDLDSFARKAGRGEIPDYRVVLYGLIFCFPYIMGLTLVSCILGCLVDWVENVRNFSDRCTESPHNSPSLVLKMPLSRASRL